MGVQEFAIIDMGSNSVRLVIYRELESGIIQEVDSVKSVIRLSEHMNKQGDVDCEGIDKAVDCLSRFKRLCEQRGIAQIHGVATAATRNATNRAVLLATIEQQTGLKFRVLDGEEEAYYGFLAIVNSLPFNEAVTIDIGGGSTEITYFKDRQLKHSYSFPFGAITLTKQFFKHDLATSEELDQFKLFLRWQWQTQPWMLDKGCPVIVMGGTARNLARIHQRKRNYSMNSLHNYQMEYGDVSKIVNCLAKLPISGRKEVEGLSKDRADIVLAGIIVFESVMESVQASTLITSTKGLRDGILFEEQFRREGQQPIVADVLTYGTEQFMRRYQVQMRHSHHVASLAGQIYDEFVRHALLIEGERTRILTQTAARLYEIGRTINITEVSKHNFYLLENVLLLGASHRERLLIGLIAAYKNSKQTRQLCAQYEDLLSKEDEFMAVRLGLIVLLARLLDRPLNQQVSNIRLHAQKKQYALQIIGLEDNALIHDMIDELLKKISKTFQHVIVRYT